MKFYLQYLIGLFLCICILSAKTIAGGLADDTSSSIQSKLPVIGLGYGAMTFIGDIGNSYYNQPFYYKGAWQLQVQLHSKSDFELFFHLLSGRVYGEEKSLTRNLNFRSDILAEGINLRYCFNSKRATHQVLIPFLSAGIEVISFNPSTDLKDANGNPYYYWADGTVHTVPETAGDASSSLTRRDYTYETNVRDANLDSVGKFNEYAVAFPLSAGVKFKISPRIALYFTETYHLTTTDYIDGVSAGSKGNRAGNSSNDKILYSSVSFHFDLAAPRETPRHTKMMDNEARYSNINFDSLQTVDSDGDGVPDFMDEDNSTPPGVKVDASGRAIDTDGDGVPDYRDKEPGTPAGGLVDEYGISITDSTQEARFVKDSMDMEMMKEPERVKTKNESVNSNAPQNTGLPEEFKIVDTDHDGTISSDEIAKAIEIYTAGKSPFKKSQFYRLIDYFFAQ